MLLYKDFFFNFMKDMFVEYDCEVKPKNQKDLLTTGCPKKLGKSVTNLVSSLLWISIVLPNFKSHNIIMSARVFFMKRVKDCLGLLHSPPRKRGHLKWRIQPIFKDIFPVTILPVGKGGLGSTKFVAFETLAWHNECFFCNICNESMVGKGFIQVR